MDWLAKLDFWANISTIWLVSGMFLMGIVPLVALYFAVRGMAIVNRTLPRYLKLTKYYTGIVRDQTHNVSQKVAEPLVRSYGESVRAETTARNLLPKSLQQQIKTEEKRP
jgi:hypothetical protein